MIRRTRSRGPRRRGAVAVELALSMVLLVLPMLFGIWEISCLLDAQQTLTQAVREGGRQAASGAMTNAQSRQVVLEYLTNAGVSTANVTVTVTNLGSGTDVSQATQLDPILVTATLPFANVDWSSTGQFVSRTAILTASCQWYSAKDTPYAAPPTAPAQ